MKHIVTIKGKKHELTTEEAKALFEELSAIFGVAKPVVIQKKVDIHHYHSHPSPMPLQPIETPHPTWSQPSITCQSRS